jgi:hypothetical protein
VAYLDGAGVKWARILGLNWSGMRWNIWLELHSDGLDYMDGDGVKWAGIFGMI